MKDVISEYIKKLEDLLKIKVSFKHTVDYNGIHPPDYRNVVMEHIWRVKEIDRGLTFFLDNETEKGALHSHISKFTLVAMPGCCGILISTQVYVWENWRKKGINKILNQMRIDLAKEVGYGVLMCTDIINNIPERNTLANNKWKDIYDFTNPRTGNKVAISIKEL